MTKYSTKALRRSAIAAVQKKERERVPLNIPMSELAEAIREHFPDFIEKHPDLGYRALVKQFGRTVRPRKRHRQMVYVIGNREYGAVKIGYTGRPANRLPHFQTFAPFDLEVFRVFWGEGRVLEERLHIACESERVRGEWFRISGRVLDIIGDREPIPLSDFLKEECHSYPAEKYAA